MLLSGASPSPGTGSRGNSSALISIIVVGPGWMRKA
jgi:hypothetical protein